MKILGSVSDQIVVVHLQVLLKGTRRDELKKVKHVVQIGRASCRERV